MAADSEAVCGPHGRMAGSKNKPKPPIIIITRDWASWRLAGSGEVDHLLGQATGAGGGLAGALIASGPVVVMAATFMNATFSQLLLGGVDKAGTPPNGHYHNCHHQHHLHHHVDGADYWAVMLNLLTNRTLLL
ncbi:hypothetical protein Nepgr_014342 [Nepenthes gracilis]|uniref:Uncharacterized protein n=1 Tax=Nepenthes gracilis TaxID=150966 RepID=A0AAD3SL01_NEPGR|nr:hypothetical protein Nepgr_014342 [Nepenthes gracilis]